MMDSWLPMRSSLPSEGLHVLTLVLMLVLPSL
jgi:hypothetical protein